MSIEPARVCVNISGRRPLAQLVPAIEDDQVLQTIFLAALHRAEGSVQILSRVYGAMRRARHAFTQCSCVNVEHTRAFAPNKVPGIRERELINEILAAKDKFWGQVEKTAGCWLWRGSRLSTRRGTYGNYGTFCVAKHVFRAHRIAWILTTGEPIPETSWLLHGCDNPPCVRPDPDQEHHLFLGDQARNMRDMVERGRSRRGHPRDPATVVRGERSGKAKLTDAAIQALVEQARAGVPPAQLAGQHGVTVGHVYKIIRGDRWAPSR